MTTAALNTVYNQYLSTYGFKGTSAQDAHKKSELRNIYNSMVRLNKESPLFLMDTGKNTQNFAIGIKEEARALRNTISSLGGLSEENLLNQKVANSSNENIASAKYIGDFSEEETPTYELEVEQLASSQKNIGNFLPASSRTPLVPDTYSFDIGIRGLNYEFQFNISSTDSNKDIQERLSRLINNADIGLKASVLDDNEGNTSLALQSVKTGVDLEGDFIFHISDDKTSKHTGCVSYLGLNRVTTPATNAWFRINDIDQSAMSNTFTIEKNFEITLHGTNAESDAPVTIDLKNDVDSMSENINHLITGYNNFLKAVDSFHESYPGSKRLSSEMLNLSALHRESMNEYGLEIAKDGMIHIDDSRLRQTLLITDNSLLSSSAKNFTTSIIRKTDQISLNPMEYIEKKIVAYKNPGRNFVSPYTASIYSGMIFNFQC